MMYDTISDSIQQYAVQSVEQTLRRTCAPVRLVSRVTGEEKVLCDGRSAGHFDGGVTVYVNDNKLWARLLSDFDLV